MNEAVVRRAQGEGFLPVATWLLRPPAAEPASPLVSARLQLEAGRAICAAHEIDVRVHGDRPEGPALLVTNHVGYFDPMIVAGLVGCIGVAKKELRGWPIIGWRLRELGVVFVDRSSPWSGAVALRSMLRAFRAGASVLNFPEGTTTDGRDVLPFRAGAFGAARIAGVPVVPVRLDYDDARIAWTGTATFLPHYAGVVWRGNVRATVTFGEPIPTDRAVEPRALADAARDAIRSMRRA